MNEAPQLSGKPLEEAIAAQPYPKVTKDSIESKIAKVDYLVLPDSTATLCNITLKNGYSVRGESACVDPRNFNLEIGKGLATNRRLTDSGRWKAICWQKAAFRQ